MIRGSEKWFLSTDGLGAVVARAHVDLAELEEQLAPEGWPEGSEPELARWLREDPDKGGLPQEYRKGRRLRAPKVAPGRTEDELEALRALGYIQ